MAAMPPLNQPGWLPELAREDKRRGLIYPDRNARPYVVLADQDRNIKVILQKNVRHAQWPCIATVLTLTLIPGHSILGNMSLDSCTFSLQSPSGRFCDASFARGRFGNPMKSCVSSVRDTEKASCGGSGRGLFAESDSSRV